MLRYADMRRSRPSRHGGVRAAGVVLITNCLSAVATDGVPARAINALTEITGRDTQLSAREEALVKGRLEGAFQELDLDQDGKIAVSDVAAFLDRNSKCTIPWRSSSGELNVWKEDQSFTGTLTKAAWMEKATSTALRLANPEGGGLLKAFGMDPADEWAAWDTNKDGLVDREEAAAYLLGLSRAPEEVHTLLSFEFADAGDGGALSPTGFFATPIHVNDDSGQGHDLPILAIRRLQERFFKMDVNKDELVDANEYEQFFKQNAPFLMELSSYKATLKHLEGRNMNFPTFLPYLAASKENAVRVLNLFESLVEAAVGEDVLEGNIPDDASEVSSKVPEKAPRGVKGGQLFELSGETMQNDVVSNPDADQMFRRMDLNGDFYLSHDEMMNELANSGAASLVHDFRSDEPEEEAGTPDEHALEELKEIEKERADLGNGSSAELPGGTFFIENHDNKTMFPDGISRGEFDEKFQRVASEKQQQDAQALEYVKKRDQDGNGFLDAEEFTAMLVKDGIAEHIAQQTVRQLRREGVPSSHFLDVSKGMHTSPNFNVLRRAVTLAKKLVIEEGVKRDAEVAENQKEKGNAGALVGLSEAELGVDAPSKVWVDSPEQATADAVALKESPDAEVQGENWTGTMTGDEEAKETAMGYAMFGKKYGPKYGFEKPPQGVNAENPLLGIPAPADTASLESVSVESDGSSTREPTVSALSELQISSEGVTMPSRMFRVETT